jgi:hypothetical protein
MDNINLPDIEHRLRSRIASLWSREEEEIESFDPLVDFLIKGVAAELRSIYDGIETADTRVLDQLSQVILPEVLIGPSPAHSILHAFPEEKELVLNKRKSLFYANAKLELGSEETFEVFFSPAKNFRLYQAQITHRTYRGALFDEIEKKNLVKPENIKKKLPDGEFWLGLKIEEPIDTTKGIPFFFYLDGLFARDQELIGDLEEELRVIIPFIKVTDCDGRPLTFGVGLSDFEKEENLIDYFSDLNKVENEVIAYYNPFYLTIYDDLNKLPSNKYPEAFKDLFSEETINELRDDSLKWIKLTFPGIITPKVSKYFRTSLNAFPVLNRKNESLTPRYVDRKFNVFSINTKDVFLSIDEVEDENGFKYQAYYSPSMAGQKKGTYSLRRSGFNRWDRRNIFELFTYLKDLIRDERMAFSVADNKLLAAKLAEIEKSIENYLVLSRGDSEVPYFVSIVPEDTSARLFINFWSTLGAKVNNLKRKTAKVSLNEGDDIDSDSLFLLRDCEGGKDRPKATERLKTFRGAFLTRNRIATVQDIRTTCQKELGNLIEDVKIKKGLMSQREINKGWLRVLQVLLIPSEIGTEIPRQSWNTYCKMLKNTLEERSVHFHPFQVIYAPEGH